MHKYLFFVGSMLATGAPVLAAEAPADPIVVTATREPTPVSQVGQSVSVVTREEIERTQVITATELLARLPGVAVTNSGGFGQPSSVFIRGADNAQSLVLIDGVRINDPGDVGGGFDFGALAIAQFDRVEVVRGASGVLWGSRAIGGVINFITQRPTEEWHARAQAEYGWRDQKQLGASAAGKLGPVGLTLGGNWLKGDGYSAFSERRGGTEKDGFESKSANARAELELAPGLSVDAGTYWTRANYDYDDTGADALHVGLKRDVTGFGNVRYAGLDGRFNARLGYALTDSNRISDHAVWGPYETNGRVERFEGQASFAPVAMATVLVGAETEKQTFNDNYASRDSTSIDSVFGNLALRPLAGLTLNAGLRYDDNSDFGDRTTFAANGAWEVREGGPVVRASYAEGFKAPSLYQLYTNAGYRDLVPETSQGWDAGVEVPFAQDTGRFSVTWFDRKTRNLIDYDFASWNYYNIGKARAQGLELGMQVADWNGFDVNLAYTYLKATNERTGARLARRPRNNLTASIDKSWQAGLRLGAELRVGGSRWDDQANTQYVDGFTTLALRGAFAVSGNVEVYGRLENVFNARYELVRTYGTPARSAYAGVRVKM